MPHGEQPTVVGLGELLWDCFSDSRRPGGAPANVAYQAGQLGCRGVICSRVGIDAAGDEIVQFLDQHGLQTEFVQRDPVRPTGKVTVDATDSGSPKYTIHENVAWDALAFDVRTEQLMQVAHAVCFGTLAQRCETSRNSIQRCLSAVSADCLVVYDVNLRQDWFEKSWIENSLQLADVVKLNHEEAEALAGQLSMGEKQFARQALDRYGLELVCITRAEQGCFLISRDETIDVGGIDVEVADTVGAGDAFTAALIAARLENWPLSTTARFANEIGALVATRAGAMPELQVEFANLVHKCRSA